MKFDGAVSEGGGATSQAVSGGLKVKRQRGAQQTERAFRL